MPKTVVPLNDTRIKALKPKAARYRISDGGGLVLEVMTSGSKVWRYRYTLHGERQPMVTIGDYPAVSLQDAREKARRYAEIVAKGVSPIADAKKDRGAPIGTQTRLPECRPSTRARSSVHSRRTSIPRSATSPCRT